jgi:aspartyl-tRNA(Asn)/glutamyl-tRNA(Gln) amidotransferase subunit A
MLPGALLDAETGGDAYTLARREVEAFTRRLDDLFNDVDVVLTPTLRILPPTFGEIQDAEEGLNYSYTKPFSLTGGPAVSVPVGSADGLPISAQVIAPPFKDGSAVRTARLLEAVTPSLE